MYSEEKVKKNMFLREEEKNQYTSSLIPTGLHTRPNNTGGDVLCCKKFYYLPFSSELEFKVIEWANNHKRDYVMSRDLPEVLGLHDSIVIYQDSDVRYGQIWSRARNWNTNYTGMQFCFLKDFTICKRTEKQNQLAEQQRIKDVKIKMANLVVKDDILKIFNDKGYRLIRALSDTEFRFASKEDFNRFINDAIENHINQIANTLNCTIEIPHMNKGHTRQHWDTIIDLSKITLNLTKE